MQSNGGEEAFVLRREIPKLNFNYFWKNRVGI